MFVGEEDCVISPKNVCIEGYTSWDFPFVKILFLRPCLFSPFLTLSFWFKTFWESIIKMDNFCNGVVMCRSSSSCSFSVGFTFLLAALSTGAALAYSGCAGSFSTNNLTRHHTHYQSKKRLLPCGLNIIFSKNSMFYCSTYVMNFEYKMNALSKFPSSW